MTRAAEQPGSRAIAASSCDGSRRTSDGLAAALVVLLVCLSVPAGLRGQTSEVSRGDDLVREFQADAFSKDDHALRLRVTTDKASLTPAERLTVHIEARTPIGWHVTWPMIGAELGEFNVVSISEPIHGVIQEGDETTGGKPVGVSLRRTIVLEPNYAEKHWIPRLEFVFVPPGGVIGKPISLTTEPIEIRVMSLLDDASAPAPDPSKGKGIATIDPGFIAFASRCVDEHRVSIIAVGGVLLVGLSGLWFVAARRRRGASLTPEMVARKRLARVAVVKDAKPRAIETAMVSLADIAREYAAAQFRLPKMDRTTEELLTELAGRQDVPLGALQQMLTQFDQVKFAGATAHAEDVRAAIGDVAGFVDATCEIAPLETDRADQAGELATQTQEATRKTGGDHLTTQETAEANRATQQGVAP